jgi:hypothetical protein
MAQAARLAVRANAKDQALFDREGMGPGDAYRGLWLLAMECREKIRQAQTDERRDHYTYNYMQTLRYILPFERPRLQAIKVEGDPNHPTLPAEEVAKAMAGVLTKDELRMLDVVAMKIITGSPSPRQTTGITIDRPPIKMKPKPPFVP